MNPVDPGCRDNRLSRRGVLRSLAAGSSLLFPGILAQLFAQEASAADSFSPDAINPLAPKSPHFAPKAKRIIFMYMSGGVSHLDTFDPKPKLAEMGGKSPIGRSEARSLRPFWDFKPGGRCGTEVSDLFPHVRECMDDICLIRSMRGD